LFVYCVNRDGTYNIKCVKRKDLSNKSEYRQNGSKKKSPKN
jgi:hypothetical protein